MIVLLWVAVVWVAAQEHPTGAPEDQPKDLEAEWVYYLRHVEGDSVREAKWRAQRLDAGQARLLEWVVLTGRGDVSKALSDLKASNAREWVRAHLWAHQNIDTHRSAENVLIAQWTTVHAWLVEYDRLDAVKLAGTPEPGEPPDISGLLPPLDEPFLLGLLQPPEGVQEFGDRRRAEQGAAYVHQVQRALDLLGRKRERTDEQRADLARLLEHSHRRVRQAAALTYTRLPMAEIPLDRLEDIVRRANEHATVRVAALLAISYGPDPHAQMRLVSRVLDPADPLWNAAVSRLADLADAVTATLLAELAGTTPEQQAVLDAALQRMRARSVPERPEHLAAIVTRTLEATAYARLASAGHRARLTRLTAAWFLEHDSEAVRAELRLIVDGYQPQPRIHGPIPLEKFRKEVRWVARHTLNDLEKDGEPLEHPEER